LSARVSTEPAAFAAGTNGHFPASPQQIVRADRLTVIRRPRLAAPPREREIWVCVPRLPPVFNEGSATIAYFYVFQLTKPHEWLRFA